VVPVKAPMAAYLRKFQRLGEAVEGGGGGVAEEGGGGEGVAEGGGGGWGVAGAAVDEKREGGWEVSLGKRNGFNDDDAATEKNRDRRIWRDIVVMVMRMKWNERGSGRVLAWLGGDAGSTLFSFLLCFFNCLDFHAVSVANAVSRALEFYFFWVDYLFLLPQEKYFLFVVKKLQW